MAATADAVLINTRTRRLGVEAHAVHGGISKVCGALSDVYNCVECPSATCEFSRTNSAAMARPPAKLSTS